ncbi:hypothetical protein ARSEF1564_003398 [Beauveria bassiana]
MGRSAVCRSEGAGGADGAPGRNAVYYGPGPDQRTQNAVQAAAVLKMTLRK